MPILRHADIPTTEAFPNVRAIAVVSRETEAQSLTVSELTLAPGAAIPLHIHPTHEEAIVLLEGTLEATLGQEHQTVEPGYTVLAPRGARHGLRNTGDRPARILAIFPTLDVQRELV